MEDKEPGMRVLEDGTFENTEPPLKDCDVYFFIEDGEIKVLMMGKIDE